MVFCPPSWAPQLPFSPPDDISLLDFIFDEQWGREPISESMSPFVCGLTGQSWTVLEHKHRIEIVAAGLSYMMRWQANVGSEWSKVACIYSPNTIDYVTAAWATIRLGGVSAPLNATSTLSEVVNHLKMSGATCIFTASSHMETACKAAELCGIQQSHVFLLKLPFEDAASPNPSGLISLDELAVMGQDSQIPLEKLCFSSGQGARQTAFLCSSSGTSGLPKGVMISHKNIITSVLQTCTCDQVNRAWFASRKRTDTYKETSLALLPFSHSYGLVVIATVSAYRGDSAVVLPKYELKSLLAAIQNHKITTLYVVPPLVITLRNNKALCDQYNLKSVDSLVTAAAPLGNEIAKEIKDMWPTWIFRQLYGITESTALVTSTSAHDVMLGSAGSLLPGTEARLLAPDGSEITACDQPGELVVRSPAIVQGYLNREEATTETFKDGWLHTGDEALFRKSTSGHEHLWITDRLKEMIKVKGLQVAPAELEAHLLTHPAVADCAVIPVYHQYAGEVPKAFVVKAAGLAINQSTDEELMEAIKDHVAKCKARHKRLEGGVEFIDAIPKLPSGKILRRVLKEKHKAKNMSITKIQPDVPQEITERSDAALTLLHAAYAAVKTWYKTCHHSINQVIAAPHW